MLRNMWENKQQIKTDQKLDKVEVLILYGTNTRIQ
jgi:hypothetical protein